MLLMHCMFGVSSVFLPQANEDFKKAKRSKTKLEFGELLLSHCFRKWHCVGGKTIQPFRRLRVFLGRHVYTYIRI